MTEPFRIPDGRKAVSMDDVDWEIFWYGDAYVWVDAAETTVTPPAS